MILRACTIMICFYLLACSEGKKFSGEDGADDEPSGTELVDEPVMVGGAYLTCNHTEYVEKRQSDGNYHIGCRIANKSNRKTISLRDYETTWLLTDNNLNEVKPVVVNNDIEAASATDGQFWHIVYGFGDTSYKNVNLDVLVAAGDVEVGFDKSMSFFDEEKDLNAQQLRLTKFLSLAEVDFVPTKNQQNFVLPDMSGLYDQAAQTMISNFNTQLQQIKWDSQRNTCYHYSGTQSTSHRQRRSSSGSTSSGSTPSGSTSTDSTGSTDTGSAGSSTAGTGDSTNSTASLTNTAIVSWQDSGMEQRAHFFGTPAKDRINPSSCSPADVQRYSADNSGIVTNGEVAQVDFTRPGTCLLDYVISSNQCAGLFILENDASSPYGYRVRTKTIRIGDDPTNRINMIRKTIEFHGCNFNK